MIWHSWSVVAQIFIDRVFQAVRTLARSSRVTLSASTSPSLNDIETRRVSLRGGSIAQATSRHVRIPAVPFVMRGKRSRLDSVSCNFKSLVLPGKQSFAR